MTGIMPPKASQYDSPRDPCNGASGEEVNDVMLAQVDER